MKTCIAAFAVTMAMAGASVAEELYDRTLEAAAIRIAAGKMGAIRGGFSIGDRPHFTAPIDPSRPTHLSARRNAAPAIETVTENSVSSLTTF